MELSFVLLFIGILSLAVGSVLGYLARQSIAKKQLGTAEGKVNKMMTEAESEAQSTLLAAKNKAVEILEEVKREEKKRQDQIFRHEKRIESREEMLDKKLNELERGKDLCIRKAEEIKKIRKEAESARQEQLKRLEKIAGLSREDAKKVLLQLAEEQNKEFLAKNIKKLEQQGREDLEKKARDIMTLALQRYAGSHAAETTTSTVSIPSDEIKGRIIGREGRNIKTLERLTGIEVIVDDTPEAIVISGFNPVRREIGKLRFRTSYGQNVLLHSLEVAHLAGALAAELGADVSVAKKAGLLHDIGKAIDHEVQGTHIEIGMNILKKFGIGNAVINAMKSHHEDFPFESNEAMIIAAADALSRSRPRD